jgi:hypothetical protein
MHLVKIKHAFKSLLIGLHVLLLVLVNVTNIRLCFCLQEELAKSQAMASDFLCHLDSLEQNIRKYADQPVVNWYVNMY